MYLDSWVLSFSTAGNTAHVLSTASTAGAMSFHDSSASCRVLSLAVDLSLSQINWTELNSTHLISSCCCSLLWCAAGANRFHLTLTSGPADDDAAVLPGTQNKSHYNFKNRKKRKTPEPLFQQQYLKMVLLYFSNFGAMKTCNKSFSFLWSSAVYWNLREFPCLLIALSFRASLKCFGVL